MARDLSFNFSYEGRAASGHLIDMGQLGHGLIGMNRIMLTGLVIVTEGRLPRRRERPVVSMQVRAPTAGSVAILGQLAPYAAQLPLLWELITSGQAKSVLEFASYVLTLRGGRPTEAQVHMENMLEQLRITEEARDRESARTHDTVRHAMDLLAASVPNLAPAAREAVTPVGRSVETLKLPSTSGPPAIIDQAMADAIRDPGDLIVGDQERIIVEVDGYQHHNRTLKIIRLDGDGFMTANVTDPAFDQSPNIYTEAAAKRAALVVDAKKSFRDGRIERLHISNAIEIVTN